MSPTALTRRALLGSSAALAGLAVLPTSAAWADTAAARTRAVRFTLNATVLDGGEQVTSVTLATSAIGNVDPASLTKDTFSVHAVATSPFPLDEGQLIFSEYDLDRTVTAARVNQRGDIVLDLNSGEGVAGAATLGYLPAGGRNVQLDLTYTITQNAPLKLRNRRSLTIDTFTQQELSSPEVDAFSYAVSASGMNYRLFSPTQGRGTKRGTGRGKRPLVVWLHGGGEGGLPSEDYYDNEVHLRANRGALGFATDEGQKIFGGAYVVAPQSFTYWMQDGPMFAPLVKEIIDEVVAEYPIDVDRILVVGCSNGGYMTMEMTSRYHGLFAGAVPICGVITGLLTDEQLSGIETPTWLVTSSNDPVVPPVNTTRAHELIDGSLLTLYDSVVWNGYTFNGHWSWIYVARNDPAIDGQHIWQWMAAQRR